MRWRVLFLCTHNSARSQMAEGLVRALAGDRWEAASAGTEATRVHPLAIRAMGEIGIDIRGHRSKRVDDLVDHPWDWVITVCDDANARCPALPARMGRVHWSVEDPSRADGGEAAQLAVFRRVRTELAGRVAEWLAGAAGEPSPPPIVSIVGRKDSGKTTLIERLVPALAALGLRVATVKHHHHGDFEADTPGKDSWRHARAGAAAVAVAGTRQLALFQRLSGPLDPAAIVRLFAEPPDLVLTEGYRSGPFPKVEVVRAALGEPPLCGPGESVLAMVTDGAWDLGVPRFALDDAAGLAAYLADAVRPLER